VIRFVADLAIGKPVAEQNWCIVLKMMLAIEMALATRSVPDSGSHPVPAGFGTIRFGPELPDLVPARSKFVPPKNRLMWTEQSTKQKAKILNMLFICRATLSSN
jgi:hypothetical protein